MRWISVNDHMPAPGQFFLAYGLGLGNHTDGPEMDICLWDDGLWVEHGTELSGYGFTHWMPLPEPPEQAK